MRPLSHCRNAIDPPTLARLFELTAYKRLKGQNLDYVSQLRKAASTPEQGKIQREADLDNAWLSSLEVISTTEMTWS
jgi:hypothetical protein